MDAAEKYVLDRKLKELFNRLNRERFNGEIEPYKLRWSTRSIRTHGSIYFNKKEIMVSAELLRQHGWDAVEQTMLHEMTHALIHQRGGHNRHTKRFWREFERRGGVRDKMEVEPNAAYVYACPTCGTEYERMRELKKGQYSCSRCDKRYNPEHRLYLKRDKHQRRLHV